MYKAKTFLALIPARGGSKRLSNKNMLSLDSKPLIAWTIDAALKSKYLDTVMVTTDNEKIYKAAKKYGAEVPFLRPKELATDIATTFDVIKHTIEFYDKNLNKKFDYIVLLQPTSPLRDTKDIDNAIKFLVDKKANAIITVCEMEHSPLWSNTLPPNLSMEKFISAEIKNKRSQDLEIYYRINGAIYICKTSKLLKEKTFFIENNIFAYIMEQEKSVDIDTKLDFLIAQELVKIK